nr:HAD family hydrolase [Streptomyces flavofungini]
MITDSARVHAEARKATFDAFQSQHPSQSPAQRRPFDVCEDDVRTVDGKAGLDGGAAFPTSRGRHLSTATPEAVAADKERRHVERLRKGDITAYPRTVRLPHASRRDGVAPAAACASRHARELLVHAGVLDLFDALVDGDETARLRLAGRPDPALFLAAARRLDVPARETAVVEGGPDVVVRDPGELFVEGGAP